MKVYELIRELTQYKPDTEVKFHVKAKIDIDVKAAFDRDDEDDEQDVTVEADIDEYFEFDDITDNVRGLYSPNITINLEY